MRTRQFVKRIHLTILFLIVILLSATGCSSLVDLDQSIQRTTIALQEGQSVGQTFVARWDGLAGVEILLEPQTSGPGEIVLNLRTDPESDEILSATRLSVKTVVHPGYYRFEFSPVNDSRQKYYFAQLRVKGNGIVKVSSAPGEAYLDGSLYLNGVPQDAQATFHLIYNPWLATWGIAKQVMVWGGILAAGFWLYILPGWGLMSLLWGDWGKLSWIEKIGLSGGISLSLYPLLMLWTDLIGLHLGSAYAWIPPIFGIAALAWHNRSIYKFVNISRLIINIRQTFHNPTQLSLPKVLIDILLVLVISLIIFSRFWAIHSVDLPMWGDSYQHTLISQLLVDNNGLFDSWQPYAELTTFTYHFGFHSAVAAFHWVTGSAIPRATLWTGQLLNILAVFSLYPLAAKIGQNRWAGIIALLIGGLLSPMPMFYVNWGRYTQLNGQVILLSSIYLVWVTLKSENPGWRLIFLSAITLAGIALSHYRILVFVILFFLAFFLFEAERNKWISITLRIFWFGLGAGILFFPWFMHVFSGNVMRILYGLITTLPQTASAQNPPSNSIGDLLTYLPAVIWVLLPISLGWGLWKHKKDIAILGLWWFFILLAANPQWFGIPGAGALGSFTVLIATYIPASLLIGAFAGWLVELTEIQYASSHQATELKISSWIKYSSMIVLMFPAFLIMVAGLWGTHKRLGDVNLSMHALALRPDVRAAYWIKEHLPQNALFLVNSFFAFNDTVVVGSDGGWWLPLLALRQTTLPPLNYGFERGPKSEYIEWVNALTYEIQTRGINDPNVLTMLDKRNVTHVYIGQQQGKVNYNGPYWLKPGELLSSPFYRPVYHQDRVWIFEVIQ